MIEIIPSINAPAFHEVQEKIKHVESFVSWCHLDVTDGIFSKHPTWRNPADLERLKTSLRVEVHLMIVEPEKSIDQWLREPVKRVIVHLEAVKDLDGIIKKCRDAGIEIGLAISPETPWEALKPWLDTVGMVQTLAVRPGPSGQQIQEEIYKKIIHIREMCPVCIIEIDGGINPETAYKAAQAGADLFVSGAYVFNAVDGEKAVADLREAAAG